MAANIITQFVLKQFAKKSARKTGVAQLLKASDSIVQSNVRNIEIILKDMGINIKNLTSTDDVLNAMNYRNAMMDQHIKQQFKGLDLGKGIKSLEKKPWHQGWTPKIVPKDKTLLKDSPEAIAKIKAENKAAAERLRKKKLDEEPDDLASGGIAGELHLNRPGYSSGLLVKLAKLLKGGKKTTLDDLLKNIKIQRKQEADAIIDMKKLMKGDKPIKVYSGTMDRPSNTWKSFKESAKDFGITPEKYAKDQFKDQWFTPFKSYADSFSSPKYLESKLRSVDLTPGEIKLAKRYVDKINKKDMLVSMRRKLDIKPYPKHHVTTDENLVLIPRYKLKELEKTKRMKTDYMILEKLKKKLGLAEGGVAGELHLNRPGYAQGTKRPGEGQYSPTKGKDWIQTMPTIDPNLRKLLEEFKKRKGLAEILGV